MNDWIESLPAVNAALNTISTVLLTLGFFWIRKGRRDAHRNAMVAAFLVSTVFLVLYVLHKYLRAAAGGEVNTPFQGEGIWAWVYYPILLTHVLLAMIIVPLILRTLYLALRRRFESHRRWARWTYPAWYYVSVTGVLVYLFLYVWFPSPPPT